MTEDEKDQILGNETKGIDATGQVTIGSRTIVFENVLTIGAEYDAGNLPIGTELAYNGSDDWIVFGKDKSGNVLLAQKIPTKTYHLSFTDDSSGGEGTGIYTWLKWEDILDEECTEFSGTVQGKTITARSIRIEDIDNAIGLDDDIIFHDYTFGSTSNFANGQVDYLYPKWTDNTKTTATFAVANPPETVKNDASCYHKNGNNGFYFYWYKTQGDTDRTSEIMNSSNAQYTGIDLEKMETNFKYVVEEPGGSYIDYWVASCSVDVGSSGANFDVVRVSSGRVDRDFIRMGRGYSGGGWSDSYVSDNGVRAVVPLPSDIQLELDNGIYKIK